MPLYFTVNGLNGDSLDAGYVGAFKISNYSIDLPAGSAFQPLRIELSSINLMALQRLATTGATIPLLRLEEVNAPNNITFGGCRGRGVRMPKGLLAPSLAVVLAVWISVSCPLLRWLR